MGEPFEEDPEVARLTDVVRSLACGLGRGDVLRHEDIESATGMARHGFRWGHVVNKVRKELERDRGIATWFERTVGYRLLTEQETLEDLPALRHRKAMRQHGRSRRSVEALPDAGLSMHQRLAKAFLIDRIRRTEREQRRAAKERDTRVRTPERTPRRPVLQKTV